MTYPDQPGNVDDTEKRRRQLESAMDGNADDFEYDESDSDSSAGGCGCSMLFSGAFFLVGTLVFVVCTVAPVYHWVGARSWPSVDCEILHSGFTMEYRYTWEGHEYISHRYNFSYTYTNTRESEYSAYTEGQIARCFVNPDDPEVAVLSKAFNSSYLLGLIGVPFALFGLLMMLRSIAWAVSAMSRIRRWITGEGLSQGRF